MEVDVDRLVGQASLSIQNSGPGPSCFWEFRIYFKYAGEINEDQLRFALNTGLDDTCLNNDGSYENTFFGVTNYFYRNE